MSGAFPLYYLSFMLRCRNPTFGVWLHLGMAECHFPELSYQELISYIIGDRNPKFGVWMHLWIYSVPFLGHFDLDL